MLGWSWLSWHEFFSHLRAGWEHQLGILQQMYRLIGAVADSHAFAQAGLQQLDKAYSSYIITKRVRDH